MGRENITDLFERLKDIRDFKTGNGYDLDGVEVALIADEIERLREALREAGDVIECYHLNTGIDLGVASRMPFYKDTISKIDAALKDRDDG